MNRKEFFRKLGLTSVVAVVAPSVIPSINPAKEENSARDDISFKWEEDESIARLNDHRSIVINDMFRHKETGLYVVVTCVDDRYVVVKHALNGRNLSYSYYVTPDVLLSSDWERLGNVNSI